MEGIVFLVILIIGVLLLGPIGFIIALTAISKINQLSEKVARLERQGTVQPAPVAPKTEGKTPSPVEATPKPIDEAKPAEITREPEKTGPAMPQAAEPVNQPDVEIAQIDTRPGSLEQQIGTRWVLIAGVITVIVGVAFFLKYAYDNALIGPVGRVTIVFVSGLIALAAGEVTRRKGFGIVAKAVTALGFAILYTAVFAAYRFYELIGPLPAYVLAVLVTAAAMLYAVSMNEVVVAVLSLLGGYLTPLIINTGQNAPIPLFGYVLVLSLGAMLCAYYRRWRMVNLGALIGSYALYAAWFETYYRSTINDALQPPGQMAAALIGLGVFFAVYLVLPLFHGLVRKVCARKEDVLLVLANAAAVFFYFASILYTNYRTALAFTALGLCAAHLVVMTVVMRRCREDVNLRILLLVIGLFFLTIAIPLYFTLYAVVIAWAVEAVVLTVIGFRYRSVWTQACAAPVLLLSVFKLFRHLPLHTGAFRLVVNPGFGTWMFVAAMVLILHVLYRRRKELSAEASAFVSQVLYAAAVALGATAVAMEWSGYCKFNLSPDLHGQSIFFQGMYVILPAVLLLFTLRPVAPKGMLCKVLALATALFGSVLVLFSLPETYTDAFTIFANLNFGLAMVVVGSLFGASWLLKRSRYEDKTDSGIQFWVVICLGTVFVLYGLLVEEIYLYWQCLDRYAGPAENWRFLASMYISVMTAIYAAALMAAGFYKKIAVLRYISLGFFAVLLGKIFLFDMSTVKSVYRIAAFLATGLTLVGVSYLYQYLRNKGFFEAMASSALPEEKDEQ